MSHSNSAIKKWGGVAIALLLGFEFVLTPWFDWLQSEKEQLDNLKEIVAKQQSLLDSQETIEQRIADFDKQLKIFENIPTVEKNQDAVLLWLKAVDTAVKRFNINVNNKAPAREVKVNDVYSVYVGQLNVSGDYNGILNLLHELEDINVGNRIRQVSLSQNKALSGKVTANIEYLRVFKRL